MVPGTLCEKYQAGAMNLLYGCGANAVGRALLNWCQPALSFVIALAENAQAYFSGNSSFIISPINRVI
jgi:hypothetical protein